MTSDKNWKPCEPGTLEQVAQDSRQQERRKTMTRRAVFSSVLVAGAGVAFSLMRRNMKGSGSLTCLQTCELAEQYVEGTLRQDKIALVDAHLAKCPKCSDHISQLRKQYTA